MKHDDAQSGATCARGKAKLSPPRLLAITLAAGSLAIPLAGCGGKNVDAAPAPSTTDIELASPGATPAAETSPTAEATPEADSYTVENLELDTSLLQDPEAFDVKYNQELVADWLNSGATIENANAALNSETESIDEAANRIAAKYDKVFIEALFVKDWKSNPNLVNLVNNLTRNHRQTLALYFYTAFPDIEPLDMQPYKRWNEVKELNSFEKSKDGQTITVIDTIQDFDNSDQNRVGEDLTGGKTINNEIGNIKSVFSIENGKIKLSDHEILSITK